MKLQIQMKLFIIYLCILKQFLFIYLKDHFGRYIPGP